MTRAHLLKLIIWLSLSLTTAMSQEKTWKAPLSFEYKQVEARLLNWELTRDRKTMLIHAKLQSLSREPLYLNWRELIILRNVNGESVGSNYDALVDRNGAGLTRTVGDFRLSPGERVNITIPFLLNLEDYPFHLELPDGRHSILVK